MKKPQRILLSTFALLSILIASNTLSAQPVVSNAQGYPGPFVMMDTVFFKPAPIFGLSGGTPNYVLNLGHSVTFHSDNAPSDQSQTPGITLDLNKTGEDDAPIWEVKGTPPLGASDPLDIGATSAKYWLNIDGRDGNDAPFQASIPFIVLARMTVAKTLPDAIEQYSYHEILQVNPGGASGPFKFTNASGLPFGLTLSEDGVVSGIPKLTQAQKPSMTFQNITFTIQEIGAESDLNSPHSFKCTIANRELHVLEPQLFIPDFMLPQAEEGVAYSPLSIPVEGSLATPYTFKYISGLPTGMSLSADGEVSGTPYAGAAEQSPWTIIVEISDHEGLTMITTDELTLDVIGGILDVKHKTTAFESAIESEFYTSLLSDHFDISGNLNPTKWRNGSSMPAGLGVVFLNGEWRLHGYALKGTAGTHSVQLIVEEFNIHGRYQVFVSLTLQIDESDRTRDMEILNTYLPDAVENIRYTSIKLIVIGGSGNFAFRNIGLPSGMSLQNVSNSEAWIIGTPDANTRGNASISIIITDVDTDKVVSKSLALRINPSNLDAASSAYLDGINALASSSLTGASAGACSLSPLSSNYTLFRLAGLVIAIVLVRRKLGDRTRG